MQKVIEHRLRRRGSNPVEDEDEDGGDESTIAASSDAGEHTKKDKDANNQVDGQMAAKYKELEEQLYAMKIRHDSKQAELDQLKAQVRINCI